MEKGEYGGWLKPISPDLQKKLLQCVGKMVQLTMISDRSRRYAGSPFDDMRGGFALDGEVSYGYEGVLEEITPTQIRIRISTGKVVEYPFCEENYNYTSPSGLDSEWGTRWVDSLTCENETIIKSGELKQTPAKEKRNG